METVAFLGLLGLGYFASTRKASSRTEGFTDSTATVAPGADRSPPGRPTVPGLPRQPTGAATGEYDLQFQLPAGGSLPSEPNPSAVQATPLHFPVPPITLPTQMDLASQAILQTRPDRWEDATERPAFVSPLTGIEFKPGEFKHANMVPFFRGQAKQNMIDTANNQVLDSYTGASKTLYAKREQAPFFEPTKEPIGNPFGFESTTGFMESRIVESRNRAGEKPVEQIRVGPGLNQGYTHLPSGGFQQQAGEEYMLQRLPRTNDLRVATNPKLTYDAPVVPGKHFITTSGTAETVGEVRKYNPDKFYLNKNGERNFVTVGADQNPEVRSAQVIKHTTRPETTKAYGGVAGQAEGKATYTIGSTRTPLAKQMGSWGFRNADLTENFNPDTDAAENDYGKSGVEIRPNERYYTGSKVHATNVVPDAREGELPLQDRARQTRAEELIENNHIGTATTASMPSKLTVYDPNDVAKTTIKETTIDGDYLGITGLAGAMEKATAYDPLDVARTTTKETTIDNDYLGITAPVGAMEKATAYDPLDVARTTIKETTIDNDYLGISGLAGAMEKATAYDPLDVARTTIKETTIDNDYLGVSAPADMAQKMTVYDPNDVARTTIKETTIDNNYLGVSAPADMAQKLTVYDPEDVARVTGRNTLADWDRYRNVGRNGTAEGSEIRLQDKVRATQKAGISAKSAYTGIAVAGNAKAEKNRTDAYAMRQYAQKENVARGRKPAGSSVKLFNGEDNVVLQYRRIVADSVNDREPGLDRVNSEPTSSDILGAQRPRSVLKLDVTAIRNEPIVVAALEKNPYVIPLHRSALVGGKNTI